MKCSVPDCSEDVVVQIGEVTNRFLGQQNGFCEHHAHEKSPFNEPGGFKSSVGTGPLGGVSAFELRFIVFWMKHEGAALFLHEVAGTKRFALPICRYEAWSIIRALQRNTGTRPFTFDAFRMVLESLGGELEEVNVDELEANGEFYHAKIKIMQEHRIIYLDVRPSDAFAMAIACDSPILVSDAVLIKAAELGWA